MFREHARRSMRCASERVPLLFLASFNSIAFAQTDGAMPEAAPPGATAMVGFLIIFVGMIVAYIFWVRRQMKKQRQVDAVDTDNT